MAIATAAKQATDVVEIEGLGEVFAERLRHLGIKTTDELLTAGATPAGRLRLAEGVGVTPERILDWVNRADLFRITGIGSEFSDLLVIAGVDTVVELSTRYSPHLFETFVKTVRDHPHLVRCLPTETEITDWIEEAKHLPRVVEY